MVNQARSSELRRGCREAFSVSLEQVSPAALPGFARKQFDQTDQCAMIDLG